MQPEKTIRFFLAGTMQGGRTDSGMIEQDYRRQIERTLRDTFPDIQVHDPLHDYVGVDSRDLAANRAIFERNNQICAESDAIIAFLPQTSMGTAIELWEAYRAKKVVVVISPLRENWVLQFLATHRYETLAAFETAVRSGELHRLLGIQKT